MPSVAGADGASDVRVTAFGKTVQVFASKQLPKKLEFFGDDFRSHYWIVKARACFFDAICMFFSGANDTLLSTPIRGWLLALTHFPCKAFACVGPCVPCGAWCIEASTCRARA
jgi:hypothetical protein